MPRPRPPEPPNRPRAILHMDFDKFFAALEEVRRPELSGRPLVVCVYSGRGQGGAVSTANYEARKLGIRSGMSISQALVIGKDKATFLPVDIPYYKQASERIFSHIRTLGNAEQASIDECFLETGSFSAAKKTAEKIKGWLKQTEKITCSIGIASNKLIAKMASDRQKPDGLTVIEEGKEKEFLGRLPVNELIGVGPKSLDILLKEHVHTIGHLSELSLSRLQELFGNKKGEYLFNASKGIDQSPVMEEASKSFSRIGTLPADTREKEEVKKFLDSLADDLEERLRASGIRFRHVSIIAITSGLKPYTRGKTLPASVPFSEARRLFKQLMDEFLEAYPQAKLRRAGVRVAGFEENKPGLRSFFSKR